MTFPASKGKATRMAELSAPLLKELFIALMDPREEKAERDDSSYVNGCAPGDTSRGAGWLWAKG